MMNLDSTDDEQDLARQFLDENENDSDNDMMDTPATGTENENKNESNNENDNTNSNQNENNNGNDNEDIDITTNTKTGKKSKTNKKRQKTNAKKQTKPATTEERETDTESEEVTYTSKLRSTAPTLANGKPMSEFQKRRIEILDEFIGNKLEIPLIKHKGWNIDPFYGAHVSVYCDRIIVAFINASITEYRRIDGMYGRFKKIDRKLKPTIKKELEKSAQLKEDVESLKEYQKRMQKHILDYCQLYATVNGELIVTAGFGDVSATSTFDDIREIFNIGKSKAAPELDMTNKHDKKIENPDKLVLSKLKWMKEKFVISNIAIGKYIREKSVKTMRDSPFKGEFDKMIQNYDRLQTMFEDEYYKDWPDLLDGNYVFQHYKKEVKDKPPAPIDERLVASKNIKINFENFQKLLSCQLSLSREVADMYAKQVNAKGKNKQKLKNEIEDTLIKIKTLQDAQLEFGTKLFWCNDDYKLSKGTYKYVPGTNGDDDDHEIDSDGSESKEDYEHESTSTEISDWDGDKSSDDDNDDTDNNDNNSGNNENDNSSGDNDNGDDNQDLFIEVD